MTGSTHLHGASEHNVRENRRCETGEPQKAHEHLVRTLCNCCTATAKEKDTSYASQARDTQEDALREVPAVDPARAARPHLAQSPPREGAAVVLGGPARW